MCVLYSDTILNHHSPLQVLLLLLLYSIDELMTSFQEAQEARELSII